MTNFDLLAWFSEEERRECWVCNEPAAVSVGGASDASFCLACGTISLDGVPIKVGATRLVAAHTENPPLPVER